MPFTTSIPRSDGSSMEVTVDVGETLFVLGANGSGKSSIMHWFYKNHHGKARWISAHRQNWFSSNAITLSPEQKRNTQSHMLGGDTSPDARWKDNYPEQRPSIAIYDLIDAENVRARSIAGAVDRDNIELARSLSKRDAPIAVINELLRLSNIPVKISVRENEQVVATKSGGEPYSIAQLSDGERNALLIAANVLTVTAGTLILIDEPERHLHRSIISPLLGLLFKKRSDCAFIVSTHDVMLPLDNSLASTLLLRDCAYAGSSVKGWDMDLVHAGTETDSDLMKDILGARRKIVFVEGAEGSLDKPLYTLVFPGVSVIAKAGCREVEQAVDGIRAAENLHWLLAFGIVDNDRRTETEIEDLRARGVYALSVFSVESVYYHQEIQRRVAERHAAVTGEKASECLENAKSTALTLIKPHVARLSERGVERAIRTELFKHLPGRKQIAAGTPLSVSVDVSGAVAAERAQLEGALDAARLQEIIERYPVRETPALEAIANKLGFKGREQYESAVLRLLMDDKEALEFVRSLFGQLTSQIDAA